MKIMINYSLLDILPKLEWFYYLKKKAIRRMHSKSSSEISPVGLLPDSAAHIARLGKSLVCFTV